MQYTVKTDGALALGIATTKSLVAITRVPGIISRLIELHVSFDGVTGSAAPVLVELCSSDGTTDGTASAVTPIQTGGIAAAADSSAEEDFSVEPTVLTVLKHWLVTPDRGILTLNFPLDRDIEQLTTPDRLVLRATAPAAVNVRAYMEWLERR